MPHTTDIFQIGYWTITGRLIVESVLPLRLPLIDRPAQIGRCFCLRRSQRETASGGRGYSGASFSGSIVFPASAVGASGLLKGAHITDPRTAKPVQGNSAAWAVASDAATADALSTAFMVMSPEEIKRYCTKHTGTRALVVAAAEGEAARIRMSSYGAWREGELVR